MRSLLLQYVVHTMYDELMRSESDVDGLGELAAVADKMVRIM